MSKQPRLLDRVRDKLRYKQYSVRTEQAYIHWIKRFIYFHAKRPARLPVVLTENEVRALLARLEGTRWLMVSLLYGTGMRLLECLRLRVKDVDFEMRQSTAPADESQRRNVGAESGGRDNYPGRCRSAITAFRKRPASPPVTAR